MSIEAMNAARWLKKMKNCVEYSLIYKIKKIEKIYFHANYFKQKVICKIKILKFHKTIHTNVKKKICDVWSNKSKSKVMFLMNCWKHARWLKMRRKALIKNWQRFLKTKHGFWSMNFFRHHFRPIWVTFLARRICCWCIV